MYFIKQGRIPITQVLVWAECNRILHWLSGRLQYQYLNLFYSVSRKNKVCAWLTHLWPGRLDAAVPGSRPE